MTKGMHCNDKIAECPIRASLKDVAAAWFVVLLFSAALLSWPLS
jgi:hypothetical protein